MARLASSIVRAVFAPKEGSRAPSEGIQAEIPFVCARPSCQGPLVDRGAAAPLARVCAQCGERYPMVAGELPVLTPLPARHLATEAVRLRREIDWFRGQSGLLAAGARRFPSRAEKHARMLQVLAQTSSFLDEILATILPHLDRRHLLDVAATPPSDTTAYGARKLSALLRRDFSGEGAAEGEIETLMTAVRTELGAAAPKAAPILVIGCGTGRLAEELAAAGHSVVAFDLSPLLLVAALLVKRRPRSLCHFQTRNALKAEDQAHVFTANHSIGGAIHPAVKYAVADASAMPFPDGAFGRIVSVYFTDVIPLSKLLPEVWRVLAPGGQLIHVGPLGYHFDDPAEHYAADDLVDELRFAGFDVPPPRYASSTHQATGGSLYTARFENLAFSAFKAATHLRKECPAPPFLRPAPTRPAP